MKLKSIKLANAIKVGDDEMGFLDWRKYDIELVGEFVIKVRPNRVGSTASYTFTSVFNCIYWVTADEQPNQAQGLQSKASRGAAALSPKGA